MQVLTFVAGDVEVSPTWILKFDTEGTEVVGQVALGKRVSE